MVTFTWLLDESSIWDLFPIGNGASCFEMQPPCNYTVVLTALSRCRKAFMLSCQTRYYEHEWDWLTNFTTIMRMTLFLKVLKHRRGVFRTLNFCENSYRLSGF